MGDGAMEYINSTAQHTKHGTSCRKSKSKRGSLGCWTSAIEADIYRTGELVSKRMDVLVSRDFSVSKGECSQTLRSPSLFICSLFKRSSWGCLPSPELYAW